jgi:glycine/D-amino acid oxidase-like deaminating enzyme/nitrite reductase/ring-hydroxylating ferredoxin subunit
MKRDGACNSLWQDTTKTNTYSDHPLPGQLFDVVIAGAGITGITTGLLLQQKGLSVMIAEAKTIGFGTTGGTTAHLNTFMDTPYHVIQKKFGKEDAILTAKAVRDGLQLIRGNIHGYTIDCGYKELPGYLFSRDESQTDELEKIYTTSLESGIAVQWVDEIPVEIPFRKALMFPGQATFHPTRYLSTLAKEFVKIGGVLVEDCRITAVDEGEPHQVKTSQGEVQCRHFIYATHIPPGVNLLHFRCAPYRSYAIAVKLEKKKDYPDALLYDMYEPYHYYRTQEIDSELFFIAGGEDHKTGHEPNTESCFNRLEAHLNKYFYVKSVVNRWSSQFFEPADGLPYIGALPGHPNNMYVATGYGGNGMVYSAVAALLLTDMIMDVKNNYQQLFDPNRLKPIAGFKNFIKEASDVVGKLASTIIPPDKLKVLADLAPGEARVVKYEAHRLAIYKVESGEIFTVNAACTHIKCEVAWNSAEKTWDCPCHGSRFSYNGEMLTAPARKDLESVNIVEEAKVKS